MKVCAYIGLGANLGDGRGNLLAAWRRLALATGIATTRLSRPYYSEPLGMRGSPPWFTNAVGEIQTNLAPEQLLTILQQIEQELGRDRYCQGRDRPIDLDLLLYGEAIISRPRLEVPHPAMARRLFVLTPLKELAPALVHPVKGLTIAELAEEAATLVPAQKLALAKW
ncbi:MAG: 2-amino-4-hydroxy-6-hydroxymethyldihydropteridine diphosphokinase [Desulfobulbaceae bacterium]|nr:MAG: 2-amino-4-hydroxy-6-hydroxymethyldihydropteridine diphosphokinase [Desulfobulbaceae bacterium]